MVSSRHQALLSRRPILRFAARSYSPQKLEDAPSQQVQPEANDLPEPGCVHWPRHTAPGDTNVLTAVTPASLSAGRSLADPGEAAGCNEPRRQPHVLYLQWTAADADRLVLRVREAMASGAGPEWEQIAADFPPRSANDVRKKYCSLQPGVSWRYRASPDDSGRRWTKADSDLLARLARDATSRGVGPEWKRIAAQFPGRSARAVKQKFYKLPPGVRWQTRRSSDSSYRRWSEAEAEWLVLLARDAMSRSIGPHWEQIAAQFPRRSTRAVTQKFYQLEPRIRWHTRKSLGNSYRRWSEADTQRLVLLVRDSMSGSARPDWKRIGAQFPERSAAAVNKKCYKLQAGARSLLKASSYPGIQWTEADSERLVQLVMDAISRKVRPGWKQIAGQFPSRSTVAVKNRFYKLQPGVLSSTNKQWDNSSIHTAIGLVRQQKNMKVFAEHFPDYSFSQLSKTRSLLRHDPAHLRMAVDGRQRAAKTDFSDPAPLKHCSRWSLQDVAELKRLRSQSRHANWVQMSQILGRSPTSCYLKLWKLGEAVDLPAKRLPELGERKNSTVLSGRWTETEIRTLTEFVGNSATGSNCNWTIMLDSLPGRSATACEWKWKNLQSERRTSVQPGRDGDR